MEKSRGEQPFTTSRTVHRRKRYIYILVNWTKYLDGLGVCKLFGQSSANFEDFA